MPDYAALMSPRAEAAFFAHAHDIALVELAGVAGVSDAHVTRIGDLVFLRFKADAAMLSDILRISCVQGVFEVGSTGFTPIDICADFALHPDFVWGEKYRGKTNETLTQFLINLAIQQLPDPDPSTLRLLDPMCGRGTTLLWATRFGMTAIGVEQDGSVLGDLRRGLKKWTKLHRQKHKLTEGWVQKTNKKGIGKFLEFHAQGASARLIIGDSVQSHDLSQRKPFDLIVTDVPYGVQHMGGKDTRNPLETLTECAPVWARCLTPGGVMALAFNSNIPKRAALEAVFAHAGLELIPTQVAHRMSESIVRDVLLMRKPA